MSGTCQACFNARRDRVDRQRPNSSARGYNSTRWRAVRVQKLASHPFCSVCGQLATDVDHLVRHDGPTDPRFWDWTNLDSKCHACHSRKTALEDSAFVRRT